MVFTGENIENGYARVDSHIIDKNGRKYSVVYRLHTMDSKWRIYDVVAENISLVNNYRSQFNRVIANSSYEELLRRLRDKAEFGGAPKK